VREGGGIGGVRADAEAGMRGVVREARLVARWCTFNGNRRQGVAVEGGGAEARLVNSSACWNQMHGLAVAGGGRSFVSGGTLCGNAHANAAAFGLGSRLLASHTDICQVRVCVCACVRVWRRGAPRESGGSGHSCGALKIEI
jgi:hypothetical protein